MVKIVIEDSGQGMNEATLSALFDPYFTTKEEGSGLGLAISYSIVQKHGGFIEVDSEPGKGSSFSLYLPASTHVDKQMVERNEMDESDDRVLRVMIMDDDEMIREIVEAMLEEAGMQVIHASTGEEALQIYQQAMTSSDDAIDVVIMDLTILGGMGGKEAIQALLAVDPEVRAIVSSGYSNDPVMANYADYGFINAVSKPFDFESLIACIRQTVS